MTQHHLIRNITISASAALLGLFAATAQAGNYQDHVLPNTARLTAAHSVGEPQTAGTVDRVAASRVPVGNYQSHAVPNTTRRTVPATSHVSSDDHDVAMNHAKWRR